MPGWQRTRTVLNWINLTTLVGLVLASLGQARLRRGPGGLVIAGDCRLPMPEQSCMTMGNLIICRHSADWLLDPEQAALLGHETRHATQYAFLGPLFWPLYGIASLWSWLLTGEYGARNWFEQNAGLAAGGYADAPLRGWVARRRRRVPRVTHRGSRHLR
jgi:hypothetical protein